MSGRAALKAVCCPAIGRGQARQIKSRTGAKMMRAKSFNRILTTPGPAYLRRASSDCAFCKSLLAAYARAVRLRRAVIESAHIFRPEGLQRRFAGLVEEAVEVSLAYIGL